MTNLTTNRIPRSAWLILYLLLFPMVASAHYGNGLLHFHDGFIHPLTGWDHVLVAMAVGIWATTTGKRIRLAVPALFLFSMSIGIFGGLGGIQIPFVEQGILLSVGIVGWLLLAERVPAVWNLVAICCFGVIHGNAHGVEVPMAERAAALGGITGLITATALLHLSGIGLVLVMENTLRASTARALFRGIGAGLVSTALVVGLIGI